MPIERILFPTKFRKLSLNALESLLVLKDAGLKEVILCHVISREDVGFVPFGGYMKDEEEKLKQEALIKFEDWQKTIAARGVDSRIVIKVGDPVPQILHAAEDEKADMMIVGKERATSTEHPFAGSNTLQIITRSKIPAMVGKFMVCYKVNDGEVCERVNDRIFDSPMLVTDWSEPCERALELVGSLNSVIKKAIIFHDMDLNILKKHDKEEIEIIKKRSSAKLDGFCSVLKKAGIDAESHLGAGELLEEIIRISRERQATMIIIGTSSKSRFSELLHGSISHEIAKVSELPTLLVP